MSGPVFVLDEQGTPLMPMAPAYARKLLSNGKARRLPHHAFTVIQLSKVIIQPQLRPVIAMITCRLHTAEIILVIQEHLDTTPLLHIIIDLTTDLPWRLRRRAGHRRRRKRRGRYRPLRRQGVPFKLRRPSLFRSTWGTHYRQRWEQRRVKDSSQGVRSATIHWRAQAIERVLNALQKLVPIQTIHLQRPEQHYLPFELSSPAERRLLLIETYGVPTPEGHKRARCCYCGTTQQRIEVEHILPRSRGGTDSWANLVLACEDCNRRKGERTPDEAGMAFVVERPQQPPVPMRAQPYIWQTNAVLRERLRLLHWPVISLSEVATTMELHQISTVVAKPISRGRRQVFTARNYPLSTPLKAGYVRIRTAIKRRTRVNAGIIVGQIAGRSKVRVIAASEALNDPDMVGIGTLCSVMRAGTPITGIVAAVQSNGRLSLLTLEGVDVERIHWQRIIVSPGRGLRVLSRERVIFFNVQISL